MYHCIIPRLIRDYNVTILNLSFSQAMDVSFKVGKNVASWMLETPQNLKILRKRIVKWSSKMQNTTKTPVRCHGNA